MVDVGGAAGLYPVCWHRKRIPTGRLDTSWVALQFVLPQKSGLEEPWEHEVLLESHSESVLAVCAFVWASLLPHCTCLSRDVMWAWTAAKFICLASSNGETLLLSTGCFQACRGRIQSAVYSAVSVAAVSRRKWRRCEWPRVWLSQLSWLAESQCLLIYKYLQNARAVHFC